MKTIQNYYVQHGTISDPQQHRALYSDLPSDVLPLCEVVQGNMLHIFWAERYGETPSSERKALVNSRTIQQKLEHIHSVNPASLLQPRALNQRLVGNCRDFSLMLVSMLREQGIPARARCGFATYFVPNHYEDHWVCEYWNEEQNRWILVDAQLDEFQVNTLHIDFDPMDVPHDQFIVAGTAWKMCREGTANPDTFGIFHMKGWNFVRGNLIRDALSLLKIELLPWDWWMMMTPDDESAVSVDVELMDQLAQYTLAPDDCLDMLQSFGEKHFPAAPNWRPDASPDWSPAF